MQLFRIVIAAASCAAFLSLGACNREPDVINAGPADPQKEALENAKPVELPPSISASRTYRCKDNSLIYVDFLSDNKTVYYRTTKDGPVTKLSAAEPGKPFTAEGHSITGTGSTIQVTAPGKGSQTCKA